MRFFPTRHKFSKRQTKTWTTPTTLPITTHVPSWRGWMKSPPSGKCASSSSKLVQFLPELFELCEEMMCNQLSIDLATSLVDGILQSSLGEHRVYRWPSHTPFFSCQFDWEICQSKEAFHRKTGEHWHLPIIKTSSLRPCVVRASFQARGAKCNTVIRWLGFLREAETCTHLAFIIATVG